MRFSNRRTSFPTPQVADFGMAKLMGDDLLGGSLLTTNVRGTLGYVAPEYAQLGRVSLSNFHL
jgi:serine/threonine protein kinase